MLKFLLGAFLFDKTPSRNIVRLNVPVQDLCCWLKRRQFRENELARSLYYIIIRAANQDLSGSYISTIKFRRILKWCI